MTESNYQPITRESLAKQAEEIAKKQLLSSTELSGEPQADKAVEQVAEAEMVEFNIPNTLAGEFTGSQLLVEIPPDITAGGAIITEAGEIVVTASIDVSALITPTGEINPVVLEETEKDLDLDASSNYIPGIPPIRASGVIAKTANQVGIPGGVHKGPSPYFYAALLTGICVLLGVGAGIGFYLYH